MTNPPSTTRRITPRDVFTILWVGLVFFIALFLLYELRRLLIWLAVSIFLAAVITPLVNLVERRGMRRGLAVAVVVLGLLVGLGGVGYLFIEPLVDQANNFADDLPELVEEVRQAPVVKDVLERFNVEEGIEQTSEDLPQRLIGYSGAVIAVFKTIGEVILGTVTIFVLTIFLLLYGPEFVAAGVLMVRDHKRRETIQTIGNDISRAVSGWVAGNLLTSLIAGIVTLIFLLILGFDYSVLLSLWVAIADLIPLIGATLGALPAIIVATIDSVPKGIIVTIYFVAYQQFENHVLQPYVYGRTIQLNPFVVLMAVLIGAELAGFFGALFALPVAGMIQVLINHAVAGYRSTHPAPAEATANGGEQSR